ncbi:hypothetical protein WMF27_37715 [Sorangium sp. So ce281]|uniref:hypothetical protein n=1 Tax=unclassified Sorangium TaxID=2621164 RepID=UPI003F5DA8C1
MAKVKFVELHLIMDPPEVTPLARFVLGAEGPPVRVVKLHPKCMNVVGDIVEYGLPGVQRVYRLEDGLVFLEVLREAYHSLRFYATPVAEMDEGEALRGCEDAEG